jgi:hypothetical protein
MQAMRGQVKIRVLKHESKWIIMKLYVLSYYVMGGYKIIKMMMAKTKTCLFLFIIILIILFVCVGFRFSCSL